MLYIVEENAIGINGAKLICEALAQNESITALNLCNHSNNSLAKNEISVEGMIHVVKMLVKPKSEIVYGEQKLRANSSMGILLKYLLVFDEELKDNKEKSRITFIEHSILIINPKCQNSWKELEL